MKNLKLFLIIAAFSPLAFVGCKKGDTGPQGPAGPDSVMYSAWITLATQFNSTDSLYEQAITAPALTSAILDKGVVLSYIAIPPQSGTDTAFFSISEANSLLSPISQALFVGEIDLYSVEDYSGLLYRYVLIPGTILTNGYNGQVYTKSELSKMTYSQVKQTFGVTTKSTTN
ncbi:MAG: hypothetical protein ABUT20_64330 [Bacteroidota bacterium]